MKQVILFLVLIIATQAEVDVAQCLGAASKLVQQVKPQLVNVTCPLDAMALFFKKENKAALNETLSSCGVPVPVVACDEALKAKCYNTSKDGKVFGGYVKELKTNGVSLELVNKFLSLYKNAAKDQATCFNYFNSITVNGKQVFGLKPFIPATECAYTVVDFVKTFNTQLQTVTCPKQVLDYVLSNETLSYFNKINVACGVHLPVSYDSGKMAVCYNETKNLQNSLVELYTKAKTQGVDKNLVFHGLALFQVADQAKKACVAAFQTFQLSEPEELQRGHAHIGHRRNRLQEALDMKY